MKTPTSESDYSANVADARNAILERLDTTADNPETSQQVLDELCTFIVNNPQFFSTAQIERATRRVGSALYGVPLETYSLGDAASDFFGEMANQAEEINPLSARNRTKTVIVVVLGVVVAAIAFGWSAGAKIPGANK